jgi:fructose-specific phosphotransferase system IIC component
MRLRILLALALALGHAAPRSARAQDNAVRFEIRTVGDSTFTFAAPQAPWVARGQKGIAVDPRRRDGLVARFVVLDVDGGVANALILGQSQKVTTDHVVLLRPPRMHWYASKRFWAGALGGLAVGFAAGKAF